MVSSQFFGDPISCETVRIISISIIRFRKSSLFKADDSVDEETLNHYCWMYSTFDIPPDFKVNAIK